MIITMGRYRLVRYDKRNWQLQEFREPAEDKGGRKAKDKSAKWFGRDCYFQSLAQALRWVYEHEVLDDSGEYDLEGAIGRAEQIADELAANMEVGE